MGTIDLISEKVATFHFIISIDNYENKIAVGDVIDSLQLFMVFNDDYSALTDI